MAGQNNGRINPDKYYYRKTGVYREDTEPLHFTGLTFDDMRRQVAGWQHHRDQLSDREGQMLLVMEDLLDIVDNPPAPF